MIKNHKSTIRVIVIVLSCIIAIVMYLSSYSIEESRIDTKLSEHLNDGKVTIVDIYEIGESEVKNLIVFFETENSTGISLLHKGLNKKYQINDVVQTDKVASKVSFIVNRADYTIIFGKSNSIISKLQYLTGTTKYAVDIDSNYIFIVHKSRGYDGRVEIVYEAPFINKPNELELRSNYGSSWKSFTTPLRSIIIVVLSLLVTSLLSKKFDKYFLGEYSDLPLDGQRIKQGRPW